VFGRSKGDRGSYKQWEEDNIAPQVVFEILSPSNSKMEMEKKLIFYDRYRVEEYYIYDPDNNQLEGWLRGNDDSLEVIPNLFDWVSPRLGMGFRQSDEGLRLYRPDGTLFHSYNEVNHLLLAESQRAESEKERADRLEAILQQYREQFGDLG
jgi:Uma2 family endonuclease